MRGTLRWTRADLRARRGQALLTIAVVAGVVAALVLSTMLLEGAVNPWKGLFARTHGADLVVYLSNAPDKETSELGTLRGVRTYDGPYQATPATLEQGKGSVKSPVQLTAMHLTPPSISTPLVIAGTWLRKSAPDGVVVEASFAAATHLRVGGIIHVANVDGTAQVTLTVIGIADTTDQGFYPQWTPGLIWAQAPVITKIEPKGGAQEEVVDFRLTSPSMSPTLVVQEIDNLYDINPDSGSGLVVQRFYTPAQVENSMASNDRLIGLLLGLFGIIALVAAPCAIANVTAGRVLMQRQDIAMLKALGFTPGQVVRMLLAEQTGLGIAGAICGVVLARVMTSPEFVRPPDGTSVGLATLPGSWVALIAIGTVATVAIATAIPAWWAGMVSPVAAVQASPPRGHLSRIARLGLLVHLPAALVLGARDSLTRRLPALLTVFGLAIPMVMITIALSCWSTIDGFSHDPGRIGLVSALTVTPGSYTGSVPALIGYVGTAYPSSEYDTTLPSGSGTFTALAVGSSSGPGRFPFQVVSGHPYTKTGEAVAGQGFLNLMHLTVPGVTQVQIGSVLVTVDVTGRILDPDNNGDVLAFGQDTLENQGVSPAPGYSVILHSGESPAAAQAELLRLSKNGLDVAVVPNPASTLGIVRVVVAVSVVILAVIGLASLLTATAIGLRDHRHETGVLAAIGLTPRQVMATLVVNTTILTFIGVSSGTVVGLIIAPRLINLQGQASGLGSGIAVSLSPVTVISVLFVALGIATAAALGMARRTMLMSDPAAQLRSPARPGPNIITTR
jgi:putative ABC transport system permease protein